MDPLFWLGFTVGAFCVFVLILIERFITRHRSV